MNEQDWIGLARRAREAAQRSLQEEAYWLRLASDYRLKLVEKEKPIRRSRAS